MSHCHALKKNNTRCRAFASIESCSDDVVTYKHTCKVHEKYFDTFQLTKGLVESLEFWPGISEFLKEAFQLELICVKEDFIASLTAHSKYSYFYLLAARFSYGFKPWNQPLYQKTFKLIWAWMGRIGPVTITYLDLFDLAKIDPVPGFYTMLYSRTRQISWATIFELSSKEDWFENMYHTEEAIHKHYTQTQDFRIEYMNWFLDAKGVYFNTILARYPYKEELIEVAWSPERLDWCLDEEDKERILLYSKVPNS